MSMRNSGIEYHQLLLPLPGWVKCTKRACVKSVGLVLVDCFVKLCISIC